MKKLSEMGTPVPKDRAEWLSSRRLGIGGSDAAAVLGMSPYATAYQVWASKIDGVDTPATPEMERGNLMEAGLLDRWQLNNTPKQLMRGVSKIHKEHQWMRATLDGLATFEDGALILEAKSVGIRSIDQWRNGEDFAVPDYYEIQARHNMAVADCDLCEFPVFLEGFGYRELTVERDREAEKILIEREEEFWRKHVETKTPPPMTVAEEGEYLARRMGKHNGDYIENPIATSHVGIIEHNKRIIEHAETDIAKSKLMLTKLAGNNRGFLMPDGEKVSIARVDGRSTTDWRGIAEELLSLIGKFKMPPKRFEELKSRHSVKGAPYVRISLPKEKGD